MEMADNNLYRLGDLIAIYSLAGVYTRLIGRSRARSASRDVRSWPRFAPTRAARNKERHKVKCEQHMQVNKKKKRRKKRKIKGQRRTYFNDLDVKIKD